MNKVTPQDILTAYNFVVTTDPDPQGIFQVLPNKLEDLTEEQQALFRHMAFGHNCIIGEMCVEEEQ